MPNAGLTLYQVLGCWPGCDATELRAAWLGLAQQLHPDLPANRRGTVKQRAQREQQLRDANYAKAVLLDADRRRAYDAEQQVRRGRCPACAGRGFTTKTGRGFTAASRTACATCGGHGHAR